jgi:SAM-dependent methyltransferase
MAYQLAETMNNVICRNCPSCGEDNTASAPTIFGDETWPIKACGVCGFVYLEVAPVYERLIDEFAWEKTSASETKRRLTEEPIRQSVSKQLKSFRHRLLKRDKLPYLIRHFVAAGNVLDIGCASGGVLSHLDKIFIPHGIEISRALALIADENVKPRGGYVVHDAALHGLSKFPRDYFSGVLLSAFLEHEIDPKSLLTEVFRTLSQDGYCIIKVPNFASLNRVIRGKKWCGFRLPDHVNYFTPVSLVRMCRKAGFEIARFGIADHLPTSDNMWIVIKKAR